MGGHDETEFKPSNSIQKGTEQFWGMHDDCNACGFLLEKLKLEHWQFNGRCLNLKVICVFLIECINHLIKLQDLSACLSYKRKKQSKIAVTKYKTSENTQGFELTLVHFNSFWSITPPYVVTIIVLIEFAVMFCFSVSHSLLSPPPRMTSSPSCAHVPSHWPSISHCVSCSRWSAP